MAETGDLELKGGEFRQAAAPFGKILVGGTQTQAKNVRAGVDDFSFLAGLVGLFALLYVAEWAVALPLVLDRRSMDPIVAIVTFTANAGWAGLAYACWFRSGRITDTALVFVLALGVCGMAISVFAFDAFHPVMIVVLTGTWILNGLGIVWIVHKVRRIRAASNTDEADAAR